MAITVRFLADVGDWLRGLGKSKDALTDTEKGLEDVLREAVVLGRQLGKTTDEIASDFSNAFGVPLDRAKSAVGEVIDETEKLGRVQGKAGDDSDKLGGKLTELGSVARDILAGDFAGAAESGLGALATFAGAAGVGGAVGGLVIEAVSGLVDNLVQQWSVFNDTVVATRDELQKALIESNGAFDQGQVQDRIIALATNTEKLAAAQLIAKATGRDVADVMLTLAGVTGNADDLLKDWNGSWGELSGNIPLTEIDKAGGYIQGVVDASENAPGAIDLMNDALGRSEDAASEANSKYNDFRANLFNPLPSPPPVSISVDGSAYERFRQRVLNDVLRVNVQYSAPQQLGPGVGRQLLGP